MKQSNRLVVTLDEDMQISFESGIQTVYLNSHLYNEFVVRPSFLLGATETLWVTFQNALTNPTVSVDATLLAERKTTFANSTKQVVDNNVTQIEHTTDTGYEYYMQLPDAVMSNVGEWYFSFEIRDIPDTADPTSFTVVSTSMWQTFTVNNSLSGAAVGGTPTDLNIVTLYIQAKQSVENAQASATAAAGSAAEAKQAAQEAQSVVTDAIKEITETATEEATQAATEATKQAIEEETERATAKEEELAQSISAETARATQKENELGQGIAAETARATAQENELAQSIQSETARATAKETELSQEIAAESATRQTQIDVANADIAAIKQVIPSSATPTNQLADQAFVNSTVNNMSAFYITYNAAGNAFPTKAALTGATTFYNAGQPRVPTQNDYATVLADESQPKGADGSYPTTRYVYQGGTYPDGQWDFQYVVNNTSLTQAQVDAINSGITSQKISEIDAAIAAKYAKPAGGIPQADLATAVQNQLMTDAEKTKLNGIEAGAQKNTVTSVNGKTGAVTIDSTSIPLYEHTLLIRFANTDVNGALCCQFVSKSNTKITTDNWSSFIQLQGSIYATASGVSIKASNSAYMAVLRVTLNSTGLAFVSHGLTSVSGYNTNTVVRISDFTSVNDIVRQVN